jgi:hypothetical protein
MRFTAQAWRAFAATVGDCLPFSKAGPQWHMGEHRRFLIHVGPVQRQGLRACLLHIQKANGRPLRALSRRHSRRFVAPRPPSFRQVTFLFYLSRVGLLHTLSPELDCGVQHDL